MELLAPAGNRERLETALRFGADAAYGGGARFGLRAYSVGFDEDELPEAVALCHEHNARFYHTLNAYLRQDDLAGCRQEIQRLSKSGVDALIVSDPGVLFLLREEGYTGEIHMSTQANTLNAAAAKFWQEAGVTRVVLARECSLADIRAIKDAAPDLELEAFVHGAMCIAYSGRCLLSSAMEGRDGNRGACSQICRRGFEMRQQDREDGDWYPIEEDGSASYVLNSRDLNLLENLAELEAAGVDSIKIEGRMKTSYYVATVCNAYRMALDDLAAGSDFREELLKETDAIRHRPYTTGFYFAQERPDEQRETPWENANPQNYEFVGVVLESLPDGRALIEQRNRFYLPDTLEYIRPGSVGTAFHMHSMQDDKGEMVDVAPHPQQKLIVETDIPLQVGDLLRKEIAQDVQKQS